MDWLNLHTSILDSPEVIGSNPIERATWLFLLRLCIGQENGGRITGAKAWSDRKWQQIARVTLREVRVDSSLWSWDSADLIVQYYPSDKEREVQRNRENGGKGGRPRKPTDNHLVASGLTQTITTRFDSAETEGKGTEGKGTEGKGTEGKASARKDLKMDTDTWNAAKRHIRWKSSDPEKAAATRQTVEDAVQFFGLPAWCLTAERIRHAEGSPPWPEAVEKALFEERIKAQDAAIASAPQEVIAPDFADRCTKWGV